MGCKCRVRGGMKEAHKIVVGKADGIRPLVGE